MDVQLTSDQRAFAHHAIESGRFHTGARSAFFVGAARAPEGRTSCGAGDARASIARGEGRVITQESMRELAGEVKGRGRARLPAELASH